MDTCSWKKYELRDAYAIERYSWNVTANEVVYWKVEVITCICYIVLCEAFFDCLIRNKYQWKLIWVDEVNLITESCIVQWESIIYITEAEIKGFGLLSFLFCDTPRSLLQTSEIYRREEENSKCPKECRSSNRKLVLHIVDLETKNLCNILLCIFSFSFLFCCVEQSMFSFTDKDLFVTTFSVLFEKATKNKIF